MSTKKHEKKESKAYEAKEKRMKSEPEYRKGKGKGKSNYKGKCC